MPNTTATPPGHQLTPWLILLLALAVLATGLGFDRYDAYRQLDARECQRLVKEASAVRENLSARREARQPNDLAASDHHEALAATLTATWGPAPSQALGQAIADLRFGMTLARLHFQSSDALGTGGEPS